MAKEECKTKKKMGKKIRKGHKTYEKCNKKEATMNQLSSQLNVSESQRFLKQEKKTHTHTPYVFPLHINICEMLGLNSKTDAAER